MSVKIEYTGNELKYIKRLIEFLERMINDIPKGSMSIPSSDLEITIFCFVRTTYNIFAIVHFGPKSKNETAQKLTFVNEFVKRF
jgi:hypothetical protein